ncbi:MAG: hypoxanthine phosphoribosyltransferase [Syntrophales bacterium]|jgi:hypoxanthine phosphoribosyltransferase|nr:hypoxanthine phosphoribosyltransferase [Syntrophales bacterium]MDY0043632.1 hypoxanthine phosphoribosyltransferase [Syntrophales bacterium]
MEHVKKTILYERHAIDKKVKELADKISDDYKECDLMLVGILKGAFIFLADLSRNLKIPHCVDFARLASYGTGTKSSGIIEITKDVELPVAGKDIILVEDIIDTGITISYFLQKISEKNPRSVKCCALIDKKQRREINFETHYVGFSLDEGFIVGYGLDYNERYRNLPDIYVLDESSFEEGGR